MHHRGLRQPNSFPLSHTSHKHSGSFWHHTGLLPNSGVKPNHPIVKKTGCSAGTAAFVALNGALKSLIMLWRWSRGSNYFFYKSATDLSWGKKKPQGSLLQNLLSNYCSQCSNLFWQSYELANAMLFDYCSTLTDSSAKAFQQKRPGSAGRSLQTEPHPLYYSISIIMLLLIDTVF